jgi:thioredoxin reductase (NADPH)
MIPVAIIGAGPAGLMAALQLRRYEIDILLVEADRVGGLLHNANRVENYPGFPGGAPGVELVRRFEAQVRAVGIEVTRDKVSELDYSGESFTVRTQRHVGMPGGQWSPRGRNRPSRWAAAEDTRSMLL